MDVNQTSVAFAGSAPHASQLAQQAQRAAQDERDDVQRATDNSVAADATDLRTDVPDPPQPVAEADGSAPARRERGSAVDLTA